MEMIWWQYLIISLASVAVGTLIGYFLNKRGVQNERDARERRQLQDAVQGLLTEICANLKIVEKDVESGILPRLAKEMWDMHKSNIIELPSAIQGDLYEAYYSIDKVNSVVENMHAFGSREGWSPTYWDTHYEMKAQEARKPMEKARDTLERWRKELQHEASLRKSNISESTQGDGETVKLLVEIRETINRSNLSSSGLAVMALIVGLTGIAIATSRLDLLKLSLWLLGFGVAYNIGILIYFIVEAVRKKVRARTPKGGQ